MSRAAHAAAAAATVAYADPIPRSAPRRFDALGVLSEMDGSSSSTSAGGAGDKQLQVALVTLWADGCCFRSPVALRPGAAYTLRIGTGPLCLASSLKIISTRDRADGFYDVGARFV